MISTAETTSNVIIADGDDDDYLIFSLAASELSFKILLVRAENGEMLLQLLEKEVPDMLFLDVLLPGKSSRECLMTIRANEKYDMLPVIMYTSIEDLKNIEFCYRNGSNLYVIKPSSIDKLKVILERIFAIDWTKSLYFPSVNDFVIHD